jgi:hypothetical protein
VKIRRSRMICAALACGVGLTPGVAGCVKQTPKLTTACGIAVDGSGSSSSTTGFNADAGIQQAVVPFLNKEGCRRVVFAPISGASQGARCTQPMIDIDPDLGDTTNVQLARGKKRQQVQQKATELLKCIRTDKVSPQGSDVLGGLSLLAQLHPEGKGQYKLLVISDFLEYGPNGDITKKNLHTPAGRGKLMDQMGSRIPNLGGADLAMVGFGKLLSKDAAKFADFNTFWTDLLINRAHCKSVHLFNATGSIAHA